METPAESRKEKICHNPNYQAFQILRFAFAAIPLIAGFDKFLNFLIPWTQYLAPQFDVFHNPKTTMMSVGIGEIIVGLAVWFKPKIFAYVFALLLLAVIVNLIMLGKFYDLVLTDFGLMLGALALARLGKAWDKHIK